MISGKGGTGKTSITAGFAALAKNTVFADCDVDAADLYLILKPVVKKTIGFHGLQLAQIDTSKCTECKKCVESCHFNAINDRIIIDKSSCEGCSVCEYVCPVNAISMVDRESGFAYISETRYGPMSHAVLKTAEEASGKLVTLVRENAKKIAEEKEKKLIIIDGPPGIGCPVISSITGVDMVLVVTEPTISAIHDLERVIGVSDHFNIPSVVCVNKHDLNPNNTDKILEYCKEKNIDVVGCLPYDTIITEALINEKNVIEFSPECKVSKGIKDMWNKINKKLNG